MIGGFYIGQPYAGAGVPTSSGPPPVVPITIGRQSMQRVVQPALQQIPGWEEPLEQS